MLSTVFFVKKKISSAFSGNFSIKKSTCDLCTREVVSLKAYFSCRSLSVEYCLPAKMASNASGDETKNLSGNTRSVHGRQEAKDYSCTHQESACDKIGQKFTEVKKLLAFGHVFRRLLLLEKEKGLSPV